jgi:hypothetical protein
MEDVLRIHLAISLPTSNTIHFCWSHLNFTFILSLPQLNWASTGLTKYQLKLHTDSITENSNENLGLF